MHKIRSSPYFQVSSWWVCQLIKSSNRFALKAQNEKENKLNKHMIRRIYNRQYWADPHSMHWIYNIGQKWQNIFKKFWSAQYYILAKVHLFDDFQQSITSGKWEESILCKILCSRKFTWWTKSNPRISLKFEDLEVRKKYPLEFSRIPKVKSEIK